MALDTLLYPGHPLQTVTMKVKQLYTYPIKSLRGTSLDSFIPTYQGFQYDRRFMLLKGPSLTNMHVSKFPEMCLFTTAIIFPSATDPGKIIVEHHAPGVEKPKRTEIPLLPDVAKLGLEELNINMHSSPTIGYNMGDPYNTWFSDCFGYAVTLAYIGNSRREILGNMAPAKTLASSNPPKGWLSSLATSIPLLNPSATPGVDEGIAFSDCAPFLVVTEKSWENAAARLPPGEDLDISKFRPNIVISGAESAFEEDFWGELSIGGEGGLRLILTQNCSRCTSLNVDYKTGRVGEGESGRILKLLQGDRRVDLGAKWSPIFGRYGFLERFEAGEGSRVTVGDEVVVRRRNEERSRFGEWVLVVCLLLSVMFLMVKIFMMDANHVYARQSGRISARIETPFPSNCSSSHVLMQASAYPYSIVSNSYKVQPSIIQLISPTTFHLIPSHLPSPLHQVSPSPSPSKTSFSSLLIPSPSLASS